MKIVVAAVLYICPTNQLHTSVHAHEAQKSITKADLKNNALTIREIKPCFTIVDTAYSISIDSLLKTALQAKAGLLRYIYKYFTILKKLLIDPK